VKVREFWFLFKIDIFVIFPKINPVKCQLSLFNVLQSIRYYFSCDFGHFPLLTKWSDNKILVALPTILKKEVNFQWQDSARHLVRLLHIHISTPNRPFRIFWSVHIWAQFISQQNAKHHRHNSQLPVIWAAIKLI
jgi:hypothetical protein